MPNTQGMGIRGRGFDFTASATDPNQAPPLEVPRLSVFTPEERAELKAIFKEALAEIHMHVT